MISVKHEKDYFNKGIQFLADYYQKNCPFKDGTIECEERSGEIWYNRIGDRDEEQ